MFLRPFGLCCNTGFVIPFASILCTCCSHFFWYCFIFLTMFCASAFPKYIDSFLYLILLFQANVSKFSSVLKNYLFNYISKNFLFENTVPSVYIRTLLATLLYLYVVIYASLIVSVYRSKHVGRT
jgi:hypothetical protein